MIRKVFHACLGILNVFSADKAVIKIAQISLRNGMTVNFACHLILHQNVPLIVVIAGWLEGASSAMMDSPKSLSPENDRKQSVYRAVNSYQKKERAWTGTPLNARLVSENNRRLSSVPYLMADSQVVNSPYWSPFTSCYCIWENWNSIFALLT